MIAHLQLASTDPFLTRLLPAFPRQYLFFQPHASFRFSAPGEALQGGPKELVVGPFTQPMLLSVAPQQLTIQVSLQPGALYRLMKFPLHELHNVPFDASNGFGQEISQVNEQLAQQTEHPKMLAIIENFLLRKANRAKDPLPIDRLFHQVLTTPDRYSVDQLADLSCLSIRQFERQFLSRLGVPPKLFIRQARFTKAYGLKRAHPQLSWAAVANECGYFDQMHFIRDFKALTDNSPGTYFTDLTTRLKYFI
ncbi:MAG: hypothetical protein JWP57_3837 [Spirosoma sp.]|nr:hypothetical protein [Spirosoma sp.]